MRKFISYRNAVPILVLYGFLYGFKYSVVALYRTYSKSPKITSELSFDFIFLIIVIYIMYSYLLSIEPWREIEPNKKSLVRFILSITIVNPIFSFQYYIVKYGFTIVQSWIYIAFLIIVVYYKFSIKFGSKAFENGGLLWKDVK